MRLARRHVLSIDDGPFDKFADREVLLVGVVTAGQGLVEGVLTTRVEVDGAAVSEKLAEWVSASRFRPVLRALLLNGISLAGLSIVDLEDLHRRSGLPVLAVQRRRPSDPEITRALHAAGFPERVRDLERAGPSRPWRRIHYCAEGIEPARAAEILEAEAGRSNLPEGLRLAHLIAQGLVMGESRGRA